MTAPLRRALLGVLALGAAVRLLYLVEQPSFPWFFQPEVDAHYYDQAARGIAAGDWSLGPEPLRMSPGYFYFLGTLYTLLGPGPWAPRLVQIALGLGLVWLVWDSARRLLDARWALVPAAAAALYGPLVYFEGHLLADSLGAFLHAFLLWLALVAMQTPTAGPGRWLGVGIAWGLCCVVRPNALPLIVPLAYAAWVSSRARPIRARALLLGAVAIGGALAIAPITLRNVVVAGEPVLLTTHGGINLYLGNCRAATGSWIAPPEVPGSDSPLEQFRAFHDAAEKALGRELSSREADAYWMDRTIDAVRADPRRAAALMLRKLHLYWNGRELRNIYDYALTREVSVVLGAPLVQFGWIAPFGMAGVLLLFARPGTGRFLALYVAAISGAIVLAYVTDRHRLPVVAPVLVAGMMFVHALVGYVRARRWGALAGSAVLLAALAWVAVPVRVNEHYPERYHQLGHAWLGLGHFAFAEWALSKSLAHDPKFLPAHLDLADLAERVGARDSALAHLRAAERIATASGDATALEKARTGIARLAAAPPTPHPPP